eukprot:gene15207-23224_t
MSMGYLRLNPQAEAFKPVVGFGGEDTPSPMTSPAMESCPEIDEFGLGSVRLNPHAVPFSIRSPAAGPLPAALLQQQQQPHEGSPVNVSAVGFPGLTSPFLCPTPAKTQKFAPITSKFAPRGAVTGVPGSAGPNTNIAGRVVEHAVVVSTPWYPKGVDKSVVMLNEEIAAFHRFMQLTPAEVEKRETFCSVIENLARKTWPAVSFMKYGSFAIGTATASSSIDVMLDRCGAISEKQIKQAFSSVSTIKSLMCNDASTAFAQVESPAGITVNISLHRGTGSAAAQASVAFCNRILHRQKAARAVYSVLRQILTQTGNLEVNTGGLSAYALLAMLGYVATAFAAKSAGQLLLQFCKFYGKEFDFSRFAISAAGAGILRKNSPDLLVVIDPQDPTGNLASGCVRTFQIQVQLNHCYAALLRWETCEGTGYKGRTPLSGVLSHQKLWARSEQLEAVKGGLVKAAAAKAGPKAKPAKKVALPLREMLAPGSPAGSDEGLSSSSDSKEADDSLTFNFAAGTNFFQDLLTCRSEPLEPVTPGLSDSPVSGAHSSPPSAALEEAEGLAFDIEKSLDN